MFWNLTIESDYLRTFQTVKRRTGEKKNCSPRKESRVNVVVWHYEGCLVWMMTLFSHTAGINHEGKKRWEREKGEKSLQKGKSKGEKKEGKTQEKSGKKARRHQGNRPRQESANSFYPRPTNVYFFKLSFFRFFPFFFPKSSIPCRFIAEDTCVCLCVRVTKIF